MSFPDRAALLARLALMRPEDQVRLLAFRETFLARLAPERLRVDLRNLGILFGLLVEELSSSAEGPAPGWPNGLRATGPAGAARSPCRGEGGAAGCAPTMTATRLQKTSNRIDYAVVTHPHRQLCEDSPPPARPARAVLFQRRSLWSL